MHMFSAEIRSRGYNVYKVLLGKTLCCVKQLKLRKKKVEVHPYCFNITIKIPDKMCPVTVGYILR